MLRCSFRPKNAEEFHPFDVVFLDPPYKMVDDIRPGTPLFKAVERLAREDVTVEDALVVFRTPKLSNFTLPEPWTVAERFDLSGMAFHFLRKQSHVDRFEAAQREATPGEPAPGETVEENAPDAPPTDAPTETGDPT